MEPSPQETSPAVPIAIICGFAMIAIAVFFTNTTETETALNTPTQELPPGTARPVDDTDYINGNPNAPIMMIEYSDYDCPHCKTFHQTLKQIMQEYGVNGQVAWTYRQLPIAQLHPNAPKISAAALCVGDIGGNDAFWDFTDLIFEERELDSFTNVLKLPDYAVQSGVSRDEYIKCMDNNRMEEKVLASVEDGFNSGARGTPYTVIMVAGQTEIIDSAQPYNIMKGVIKNLVEQLDGSFDPEEVPKEIPERTEELPAN